MTIHRRITGLLATLLIAAILTGLPIVLLAIGGNPLLGSVPTLSDIGGWFTRPDDGSVALQALYLLGWLVWLALAVAIISEIIAAIRGITAPTLPGFKGPQLALRQLVAAAALLFVSAQALPGIPVARADDTTMPPPVVAQDSEPSEIEQSQTVDNAAPVLIDHVVQSTDTLSGLARSYLGDADRWPEIFDASADVAQLDGEHLTNPDLIRDGWTLKIPTMTTPAGDGQQMIDHLVGPADTLSGLAQTYLGDADRWPEIFDASTRILQPDGQHLTHPDLIQPGWRLLIPATATEPEGVASSDASPSGQESTPENETLPEPGPANVPPVGEAPVLQQTTAPEASPTTTTTADDPAPSTESEDLEQGEFPWLLTGLSTGGVVLASAALFALRARRRQQFRERRPGRAIAPVEPRLAPVEKTITVIGTTTSPTIQQMDQALRALATTMLADHQPMPTLTTVELRKDGALVLHLSEPVQLPPSWTAEDSSYLVWRQDPGSGRESNDAEAGDQPAPYPLLVTCGSTQQGDIWLVNLEQLSAIQVVGDLDYRGDYLRYIVAELALNPWSANTTITCTGLDDLTALNPERLRLASSLDDAIQAITGHGDATRAAVRRFGTDAATARAGQAADEIWLAHVLVAENTPTDGRDDLSALVNIVTSQPGQTAIAIISDAPGPGAVEFAFTSSGRIQIPDLGLDLIAVGLTRDEALGCAQLLSVGTNTQDVSMPATDDLDGWHGLADQAGALRDELTLPRSTPDFEAVTGLVSDDLPLPASTLEEDIEILDPKVSEQVRDVVEDTDPELDQDVADWLSDECPRPRLTLLGPVTVRAHGAAIAKRKPFYTEVLSILALREHGATPDELATALGYTNLTTVRTAVTTVRDWLGTNPATGRPHLPAATESRAAQQRGVPTYQVDDLLIDINLFRRLRLRGQACGEDGVGDLVTALGLVTGRPFDQLRPGGWSWLTDTSIDHHMTCAIVDVAHLLATHFLQQGEVDRAQAVTETALLAAPYDEIPKLDMAAILKAQGHDKESRRLIEQDICNAAEDDGLPAEIGQRTEHVLANDSWQEQRRRQFAS